LIFLYLCNIGFICGKDGTNVLLRYHLFWSENFGIEDIKQNRQRKEISDNDLDSSVFQFQYFLFIPVSDIKTSIFVFLLCASFARLSFKMAQKSIDKSNYILHFSDLKIESTQMFSPSQDYN
jgi:hypothetical protein